MDAFRTYSLVGLGDKHGSQLVGDFRIALVKNPRFADVVDDVVVEFGAARYQDVIDRFASGEDVSDIDLRRVWEDTTVANPAFDRPIYENFFRAIREANLGRPRERRIRILLGDPPINWDEVHDVNDYRKWALQRSTFPAELIQREVIGKHHRALAVFGDGHFQARSERPPRDWAARLAQAGMPMLGIASASGRIAELQRDAATWPVPSVAFVAGTPIGTAPYDFFYGPTPPGEYWATHSHFQDHLDAVLYLGPVEADRQVPLTYPRCAQPEYVSMRLQRMDIAGMRTPPGAPTLADRIKQDCIAPGPQR